MPLETTYRITCDGCGAVQEEVRAKAVNQEAPAFSVPAGWTEDKNGVYCPGCSAAR